METLNMFYLVIYRTTYEGGLYENLKYVLSRNLLHYIQGESNENLKLHYIRWRVT